ncbi:MAG: fieF [Clostridia bacterium]|jgi:cation diffusion facilitator family transporter|nr:fieF [Clostridia bacterium]
MEKESYRSLEGKKVTFIGFGINAVLVAIKIFAGVIGRSGAMIADGMHSLSDFLTDIVVLVGFKLTEQPEDDSHNYGHDKYETLVTAIIGIFLVMVGFKILKSGLSNIVSIIYGETLPKPGVITLAAAAASIICKELLYRYTVVVGNRINSSAIIANAWHHRSDALSSIGVLLGIGGAIILGERWTILDPIASIIVSLFIFKLAFEVIIPAVKELMEAALSDEEREKIKEVLVKTAGVKSFHKLRTRRIGAKAVIETHVLVERHLNIMAAHDIATEIEIEFKKLFGETSIITIHIEPIDR